MIDRHLLCIYPWLELGGADKFNLDMLACLIDQGWRATIVTTNPSQHPWHLNYERLTDDIVDMAIHSPEQYPERLLEIVRSRRPSHVLISCSSIGYDLLPYLRMHFPGMTFVDYCHTIEPTWRDGGYPRMSLSVADALHQQIVSSYSLKQWMCEHGGTASRIAVCTTNIDADLWNPARYDRQALRAQLGIPDAAPVVLYTARLERQKQPLLAIRVMKQVSKQAPSTYFLIAGDGPFAGSLRGFIKWHRLGSRVRILGAVGNERVRELLALSDILFLPSQMEGISLAVYEAMAMGVVPVSAAVGGQAELVTPACGYLITPGPREHKDYVATLVRLLSAPADLRPIGQVARARVVRHFGLADMGQRLVQLLERAQAFAQTEPYQPLDPGEAHACARAAIATAHRLQRKTLRRRLRGLYWNLAEYGTWWVIPWIERARRTLHGVRQQRRHRQVKAASARVARASEKS
jgi:glycosyltransferase involved in cell wall biosynthesis